MYVLNSVFKVEVGFLIGIVMKKKCLNKKDL